VAKLGYGRRMTTPQEHRSVEERREQLVDAALAVMTDDGLPAVTTRAVTARAGLPHGAFHYCFGSKADLFRAVLERELRRSMAAAFAVEIDSPAVTAKITAGIRANLDLVRARPDAALALTELISLARRDPALHDLARWEHDSYLEEVTANVEAWSSTHSISWRRPVVQVSRVFIAVSEGVTSSWLSDRDDEAAEQSIALAADALATLAEEGAA
jgi:AcrR family transcriptional regulator